MQKKENKELSDKNQYGGFLTTLLKIGDHILIGNALIIVKEIKQNCIIISIRAPKDEKIVKGSPNG
jgi:hypothetical protein